MKCVRIIIRGYVQGVFFRSNTRSLALKLNLKGFVRNLSDGSVEVIAEGSESSLNKLIEFCNKGPKNALVEEVKVRRLSPKDSFKTFDINY